MSSFPVSTDSLSEATAARRSPRLAALSRRDIRVLILLVIVALLSLTDLYLTIYFTTTIGLNEGNPLARWIMSFNQPWLLGVWKLVLIGVSTTLLVYTRKSRSSEIGSWACLFIMVWLMCRWSAYIEHSHRLPEFARGERSASAEYVRFDVE